MRLTLGNGSDRIHKSEFDPDRVLGRTGRRKVLSFLSTISHGLGSGKEVSRAVLNYSFESTWQCRILLFLPHSRPTPVSQG